MKAGILDRLGEIGSLVEPYLEKYLASGASEEFREAVLYQVKTGGKRVRPALTILSALAAGGRPEDALPIAAAIELVHNYSLILDDIIDRGEVRRGLPTTWKKYGLCTAILAAVHYREAIAEAICESKHSERLHELIARTIKTIVEGERLDVLFEQAGREGEPYVLEHRREWITLDDYFRMVYAKTGALIEAACRAGAIVADAESGVEEALGEYGECVGIAFQIADDIIDIFGKEEEMGKKVGKDVIEHKLGNVVLLLALEELESADRDRLLSILRSEEVGDREVAEAVELVKKTSARERAYELGEEYLKRALSRLAELPDSDAKRDLAELAEFVLYRAF